MLCSQFVLALHAGEGHGAPISRFAMYMLQDAFLHGKREFSLDSGPALRSPSNMARGVKEESLPVTERSFFVELADAAIARGHER